MELGLPSKQRGGQEKERKEKRRSGGKRGEVEGGGILSTTDNIVEDEILAAIALGVWRIYSSEGVRIDTILEKTWEHQMPSQLCDLLEVLASSSDVLISQRHGNGV